jgi:predicted ATP-grasp superfamily ATP-dependent carboligase
MGNEPPTTEQPAGPAPDITSRTDPTLRFPYCGQQAGEVRLLITDPLHPVVECTVGPLKARYPGGLTVFGVSSVGGAVPPPSLESVLVCPAPDDPRFVSALAALVGRYRIDVVLPWTDADAPVISRHAPELAAAGAQVACAPAALVRLACDKWATLQRLAELSVPTPATYLARSAAELADAAGELGYPARSLMLKPRGLAGGRGVWSIRSAVDLTWTSPRPRLPLEAIHAAVSMMDGPVELLVQEEVPGVDISVDVLAIDGKIAGLTARTRTQVLGGLCVQGTVAPGWPELDQTVARVIAGLGWSQLANVQLIADRSTGAVKVYEINGRAAGSLGLGSHAGVDLLATALEYARSGRPPERSLRVGAAVGFRRYWQDQTWPL